MPYVEILGIGALARNLDLTSRGLSFKKTNFEGGLNEQSMGSKTVVTDMQNGEMR